MSASHCELLLLRHAKSDWHSGAMRDHDRPLNDRGRKAAPRMGRYLTQQNILPQQVLCSTALRARQTLAGLLESWPANIDVPVRFEPAIYEASRNDLLRVIETALSAGTRLLVIGHNPGMEELLHYLISPRTTHPRLTQGFPTCALAQICLPDKPLEPGSGHLARLEFVRQIEDQP
ncbi:MAG: histidine phosphatase family protein [Oceanococcaceae bacterium]